MYYNTYKFYLTKFLFQAHYRIFGHFIKQQKSQRTHIKPMPWMEHNKFNVFKENKPIQSWKRSFFFSLYFFVAELKPIFRLPRLFHSTEPVHIVAIYYMRIFSYFTNILHKFSGYTKMSGFCLVGHMTAPIPLHMEQFK